MIATLEREASASILSMYSSSALLLIEHTRAAGLMEDKIVATTSGKVNNDEGHRYDDRP